jgi:5-(carboxyamino)imidazole ribonucleotide mutase
MSKEKILIILGSKTDLEAVAGCGELLQKLGVKYRQEISSAHRRPAATIELVKQAEADGVQVIIAAAGMAAHLPGFVASQTVLPVIGVPLAGSALGGMDSLLSIVQMPTGVPVATMTIGPHGAKNAALMAVQILALCDQELKEKIEAYRRELGNI